MGRSDHKRSLWITSGRLRKIRRADLSTSPKPFTARSLVGMTQGARKRDARWQVEENLKESEECYARLKTKYPRTAEDVAELTQRLVRSFRKSYRIGERLSPCPWCSPSREPSDDCAGAAPWVDALARDLDPPPTCDGSGVIVKARTT